MACITAFFLQVRLDKQQNKSAMIPQLARSVEGINSSYVCVCYGSVCFLWWSVACRCVCACDSYNITSSVFVLRTVISVATAVTPGRGDACASDNRPYPIFRCVSKPWYICIHFTFSCSYLLCKKVKECRSNMNLCTFHINSSPSVKIISSAPRVLFSLPLVPCRLLLLSFFWFSCHYSSITSMSSLWCLWCKGVPCHPCWGDLCRGSSAS